MDPRTYLIGLPVVITVHDDGTVTAHVDLGEASDAPFESPEFYDDENNLVEVDEDTRIADRERIENAVIQALVKVSA